ncbi:MAG: hypothetical protein U0992_06965 [Planctomycetaceae bacterium]
MLLDVNIIMDIGSVRSMTRFDPKSVSVYYLESTGTVDDEDLSRQIERTFADRDLSSWDASAALGPLLGVAAPAASGGNPLTELFKGYDRRLKGTTAEDEGESSAREKVRSRQRRRRAPAMPMRRTRMNRRLRCGPRTTGPRNSTSSART